MIVRTFEAPSDPEAMQQAPALQGPAASVCRRGKVPTPASGEEWHPPPGSRRMAPMLSKTMKASEVADRLGVWPGSVFRWKKAYKKAGAEGLRAKPYVGATRTSRPISGPCTS